MPKNDQNSLNEDQFINDTAKLKEAVLKSIDQESKKAEEKPTEKKIIKRELKSIEKEAEIDKEIKKPKKETTNNWQKTKSSFSFAKAFTVALVSALVIISGVGLCIYKLRLENPVTIGIAKFIPYPAALINYKPVLYHDWYKQSTVLKNFYKKEQQDNPEFQIPPESETEQHILNRMIERELLNQIASKYNISIGSEEINQHTDVLSQEVGGQEVLENQLKNLYNWSIKDFQKEILEPVLIRDKVRLALTLDDRLNEESRSKAEEILKEVKNGEISFEQLAAEYSEDITAVRGGDLGYFGKGQMIPEFEKIAFSLEPGKVSNLVKTQFGYHIIKVEEVLQDDQGEISQIRAKHILIRSLDLETYLEEIKKKANILQLVRI